jgi:hypothetical protein
VVSAYVDKEQWWALPCTLPNGTSGAVGEELKKRPSTPAHKWRRGPWEGVRCCSYRLVPWGQLVLRINLPLQRREHVLQNLTGGCKYGSTRAHEANGWRVGRVKGDVDPAPHLTPL